MGFTSRYMPSRVNQYLDQSAISRWRGLIRRIDRLGPPLESLTADQLRKQSLSLRYQARAGKSLDDLLPEAFALVRESSRRTIGLKHYPVQLLGGIAMHHGSIVVMQTGEGKTLTATLPLYLAALAGQGAHLATANDYLAGRDAEQMTPVMEALGLSVGTVLADTSRAGRQKSYACDVTYSTAKEIGFDFLRDRLVHRKAEHGNIELVRNLLPGASTTSLDGQVQRGLHFMLVDEADSILIDEARTPLIVSSVPGEVALASIALYQWAADSVGLFNIGSDFTSDNKTKKVTLTAGGRRKVRTTRKPELLQQTPIMEIYDQMEQAIFVELNYIRDRHYVIRKGEVVIVDEFTGRLAEGRKWRAGLHQAIEAREELEVSVETGEAARVTIQDLFLRYDRLCGMTGTVANSATELRNIYSVRVIDVPTNKPPRRKQWPTMVFASDSQKWHAIADEVESIHRSGRPVLVGTRSIDKSEHLAELLLERGIEHEVLNARHLAKEASIVAQAGEVGRVTVATNMAGRGTDIKISDPARDLGGLHVICTELHESSRIDRQLIGRCGRQGDPGSWRQFFSLEDEILDLGLGKGTTEKLASNRQKPARVLARFATLFDQAQAKIEKRHFDARKMLLHQEKLRHELQREMGQDPYLDTAGA